MLDATKKKYLSSLRLDFEMPFHRINLVSESDDQDHMFKETSIGVLIHVSATCCKLNYSEMNLEYEADLCFASVTKSIAMHLLCLSLVV